MEQNQNEGTGLFGLGIDPMTRMHLSEAARWGRFLAIVGFIFIGLFVLLGLFGGSMIGSMGSGFSRYGDSDVSVSTGPLGAMVAIMYVLMGLLYFFPTLFMYKFAANMKTALAANNQESLNASFQNLKACLRFIGVLMIIGLVFVGLGLLMGILGAASMA